MAELWIEMTLSLLRLLLWVAGPGEDFEPYGSAQVAEILEKSLNHVVVSTDLSLSRLWDSLEWICASVHCSQVEFLESQLA